MLTLHQILIISTFLVLTSYHEHKCVSGFTTKSPDLLESPRITNNKLVDIQSLLSNMQNGQRAPLYNALLNNAKNLKMNVPSLPINGQSYLPPSPQLQSLDTANSAITSAKFTDVQSRNQNVYTTVHPNTDTLAKHQNSRKALLLSILNKSNRNYPSYSFSPSGSAFNSFRSHQKVPYIPKPTEVGQVSETTQDIYAFNSNKTPINAISRELLANSVTSFPANFRDGVTPTPVMKLLNSQIRNQPHESRPTTKNSVLSLSQRIRLANRGALPFLPIDLAPLRYRMALKRQQIGALQRIITNRNTVEQQYPTPSNQRYSVTPTLYNNFRANPNTSPSTSRVQLPVQTESPLNIANIRNRQNLNFWERLAATNQQTTPSSLSDYVNPFSNWLQEQSTNNIIMTSTKQPITRKPLTANREPTNIETNPLDSVFNPFTSFLDPFDPFIMGSQSNPINTAIDPAVGDPLNYLNFNMMNPYFMDYGLLQFPMLPQY